MLKLYNTLTRKEEEFLPITSGEIGFYSCGPTVYDYAHIGHARTFIFADVLERVLKLNGFTVRRVMNITDVGHLTSDADTGEDKMEKGALREQKSVNDIARFYTDDFMTMLSQLNIKKPEFIPKATEYIPQMINLIKQLEEKEYTYRISDGIYFDTSKFPRYGILTGQSFQELQQTLKAGARVEMVSGKKNVTDFALWKFTPSGVKRQMEWDSPWGKGFPGWHIECSAMSMKILGQTFDIHTGGVDHIQVHHTNEIAQSEAATGRQFVHYWVHGEHLLVEGQKMSKSLKNFIRVKDLIDKGYNPLALRYLFLTASYRIQLNFTWKALTGAQNALNRLYDYVAELRKISNNKSSEISVKGMNFKDRFMDAVNNDLNTANAVSVMWELLKSDLLPAEKYILLLGFDSVLGLVLDQDIVTIPEDIRKLAAAREQLRLQQKYEEADEIRRLLSEKGYEIKDTPEGAKLKKKLPV